MKKILKIMPLLGGLLTLLFLSGKIIHIPYGTSEGGLIGATGFAIIGVCMFIIIFTLKYLIKKTEENNIKKNNTNTL